MSAPYRMLVVLTLILPAGHAWAQGPAVPSPESFLGFSVGADRRLADWRQITAYMNVLAEASDRVRLDTLGETTLGRPFISLTISSSANLARLDQLLEVQRRLADPRRVGLETEAEELVREGRTVVLITGGIHSTEVGGYQVPMRLAYRLAAGTDDMTRTILDQVILLLVPSLNPDGSQMVVDWYEGTLGEPWEGAGPPFLYHHYVGHDNNRDWYAFTQKETRLAVTRLHNVWHPQIVHDIHQMGSTGPRFFVPPWTDPIEPNVDPLLVAGFNALGTDMAWEMYGEGKTGIVVNAIYDAWTPARAYQHYHGGVRILTETASARLASPVVIPADSLRGRGGVGALEPSWRFPDPWPGGEWRLSDIVDYMEAGAFALLKQAALYRERWLRNFYRIGLRGIAGGTDGSQAYLIPLEGQNEDGLAELLRILVTGDLEVHQATAPFVSRGRRYAAGTYVIPMQQPYSSFARTLLEPQEYPALRDYPEGPLRTPYDATAHTLPLMMGVEVVAAAGRPGVELSPPIRAPEHQKVAVGLSDADEGPRVGIYESWVPSMDAGWTRWMFDEYAITYEQLRDADIRRGGLAGSFDVIILPDQSPGTIIEGHKPGSMPPQYVGGLGEPGVSALKEFVETGGTLVTFNRASELPILEFPLPVTNVLEGLGEVDFFVPGSIVRLELEAGHPLSGGMPLRTAAWFERGLAFVASGPEADDVDIVGRFGKPGDLLLSGWMTGDDHLAGRGAIAVVRHGAGRVLLFGFKPQYRGQTVATFPLIFNVLRWARAGGDSSESGTRGGIR